jgi:putative membrane protein
MNNAFVRWIVLTLAVFLAATVVPGIEYAKWTDLLIAGLVLGILNTFLKPIITLLSLPFIVLTLGLFLIIVNALTLSLTAWLVNGFDVHGFWPAVFGSLIISLVNLFFGGNKTKKSPPANVSFKDHPGAGNNPAQRTPKKDDDVIDI